MLSQKTVKRIAVVIAIVMIGSLVLSAIGSGLSIFGSAGAATTSELKQKLSEIEAKQKQVKSEIAELNKQVEAVSEKKAKLDEQMEITEDEIDTVEKIIKGLEQDIETTQQELDEAQLQLDNMQVTFEKRIRSMYEQGDTTYLDVVLGSNSFGEMIERMEIVSQVMEYDRNLIAKYTETKETIAAAKAKLEEDKADQEDAKGQLEDAYDALEEQRNEQQRLQDQLENDIELKERDSKRMESEKSSINAEIAEISRREAAAAASGSGGVPYSGSYVWPLPSRGTITSPYGWRNLWGSKNFHSGTDIAMPKGTTIKATAAGTVVKSGMYASYGNYVVVDHGGGVMSGYAHMSRRSVSVGDKVSQGQKLGEVGSTGNSSGNHLHFQIFINGSTTDPMQYFN